MSNFQIGGDVFYESIVDPNAYVAAGFQGAIMPDGYKQQLSEQQLADLIEFLMTQ
jgi:hypothetical protein